MTLWKTLNFIKGGSLTTGLLLVMFGAGLGQVDNSVFLNGRNIDTEKTGSLDLALDILLFTRNNEYFNRITDGYTLYGFQFAPYLTYHPKPGIRIDAGFYAQKDFGNRDFSEISPILTVMFDFGPIKQIIGNLDGSLNHGLIEPIYDFEGVLKDRMETGMQSILTLPNTSIDLWVNWETMIYRADPNQEEVSGGLVFNQAILNNEGHKLSVPIQLFLYHRGGQIDINPNPAVVYWNHALGLSYEFVDGGRLIHRLKTDNYYVYSKDLLGAGQLPFNDGDGLYLNLTVETLLEIRAMASYWLGREFYSQKGGGLYQSKSRSFKFSDHVEQERELIILRFMHDLHMEDVTFTTRVEPHFDIRNKNWEFSFGFYLNYYPRFFLKELDEPK